MTRLNALQSPTFFATVEPCKWPAIYDFDGEIWFLMALLSAQFQGFVPTLWIWIRHKIHAVTRPSAKSSGAA